MHTVRILYLAETEIIPCPDPCRKLQSICTGFDCVNVQVSMILAKSLNQSEVEMGIRLYLKLNPEVRNVGSAVQLSSVGRGR